MAWSLAFARRTSRHAKTGGGFHNYTSSAGRPLIWAGFAGRLGGKKLNVRAAAARWDAWRPARRAAYGSTGTKCTMPARDRRPQSFITRFISALTPTTLTWAGTIFMTI